MGKSYYGKCFPRLSLLMNVPSIPSANLRCPVLSVWAAGLPGMDLSSPAPQHSQGCRWQRVPLHALVLEIRSQCCSPTLRQLLTGLPLKKCCFFSETSFSGVDFFSFLFRKFAKYAKAEQGANTPLPFPHSVFPKVGPCTWPLSFSFSSAFGAIGLPCGS